jgi:hypothetical protein
MHAHADTRSSQVDKQCECSSLQRGVDGGMVGQGFGCLLLGWLLGGLLASDRIQYETYKITALG